MPSGALSRASGPLGRQRGDGGAARAARVARGSTTRGARAPGRAPPDRPAHARRPASSAATSIAASASAQRNAQRRPGAGDDPGQRPGVDARPAACGAAPGRMLTAAACRSLPSAERELARVAAGERLQHRLDRPPRRVGSPSVAQPVQLAEHRRGGQPARRCSATTQCAGAGPAPGRSARRGRCPARCRRAARTSRRCPARRRSRRARRGAGRASTAPSSPTSAPAASALPPAMPPATGIALAQHDPHVRAAAGVLGEQLARRARRGCVSSAGTSATPRRAPRRPGCVGRRDRDLVEQAHRVEHRDQVVVAVVAERSPTARCRLILAGTRTVTGGGTTASITITVRGGAAASRAKSVDRQPLGARRRVDPGRPQRLLRRGRRARPAAPARDRSVLRRCANAASITAKTSARSSRRGGSRRSNASRPESTFGTGQNTAARHRPGPARGGEPGQLHARHPVRPRCPAAAASRSATSACTITSPRRSVGSSASRCSTTGTRDVVGQVRDQRGRRPAGRQVARPAAAARRRVHDEPVGQRRVRARRRWPAAARPAPGRSRRRAPRRPPAAAPGSASPSPGPTSSTTSSGCSSAARTIRRTVLASCTKFCPSRLVGRSAELAARARTSAGPSSRASPPPAGVHPGSRHRGAGELSVGQAELAGAGRPGAVAAAVVAHLRGDRDLLLAAGLVRQRRVLRRRRTRARLPVELQAAVVAVAGVDRPVAGRLAVGEPVPRRCRRRPRAPAACRRSCRPAPRRLRRLVTPPAGSARAGSPRRSARTTRMTAVCSPGSPGCSTTFLPRGSSGSSTISSGGGDRPRSRRPRRRRCARPAPSRPSVSGVSPGRHRDVVGAERDAPLGEQPVDGARGGGDRLRARRCRR